MADRVTFALLFTSLALLAASVAADPVDPTRPPPGFSAQPGAAASASAREEAPLAVSSLFLMGARPYAVIDGQIVRPGDPLAYGKDGKVGKVGKIDAMGVWLVLPGGGKRLLKLLPDVVKTPVVKKPVGKKPVGKTTNDATSTIRMEKRP
ncbi:MAG: hypothetical protein B7Y41_02015 [Hydrogenophilales bacterium 28-61-23]|nr:MAG: hypothetical protein B7Y41_02015 [Hydrogenophilales bacterium 28-61-23]